MSVTVTDQGGLNGLKNSNIVQAWLVLLLAVCFGSALAAVHLKLAPKIEENKINETMARVPELVLGPELAAKMTAENQKLTIIPKTITVEKAGRKNYYSVFEASYHGKLRGFVVKTGGQGYGDRVELLLGLSPGLDTITGLFVLEQKETPGLGNRIIEPKWREQFVGKKTASPLKVVKSGGGGAADIDAVTGATISSRSVTAIVNNAVSALKGPLSAKQNKG